MINNDNSNLNLINNLLKLTIFSSKKIQTLIDQKYNLKFRFLTTKY